MHKSLLVLICLGVTGVAQPAHASDAYFGGLSVKPHAHLLGPVDVSVSFLPKFQGGPLPSTALSEIRIGYNYSRLFKMEAEFATGGGVGSNASSLLPVSGHSIGVDAVGTLPVWSRLSLLGRAGYRRVISDADSTQLLAGNSVHVLNQAKLGLGLQYQFSRSIGFRAEVERFRNVGVDRALSDGEGDSFTLGVYWRF